MNPSKEIEGTFLAFDERSLPRMRASRPSASHRSLLISLAKECPKAVWRSERMAGSVIWSREGVEGERVGEGRRRGRVDW